MNRKLWISVAISFVVGLVITWSTNLVDVEDNCSEIAMTCYRDRGYPLPFYHGLGYEGLPWNFNAYYFVIDVTFWVIISIIVVMIIFPFFRDNLLSGGTK